jgi:uncharacterized repeat protein (TIGR01451 family)
MKKIFFFLLTCTLSLHAFAQATVTLTVNQPFCNSTNLGSVTAITTGLTPPLTFQWGRWGETTHSNINTTGDILNNLDYAVAYVRVRDVNNLSAYANIFAGAFKYHPTIVNATCPVLGSLSLSNFQGGAAPYTLRCTADPSGVTTTTNPAALSGGDYAVKILDANSCIGTPDTNVNYLDRDSLYIQDSNPLNIITTTTPANCTNGAISVTSVTNGLPPYAYTWGNGAHTTSINNLSSGSYSVMVSDANNCYGYQYNYVPQSSTIEANITQTNTTCANNDGAAQVFVLGGTAPYTYTWEDGSHSSTHGGLSSGVYYRVTVSDANNCRIQSGAYLSANTPIQVAANSTQTACATPTGTVDLTITGGTLPYSIRWGHTAATSATLTNLAAGTYAFTVTDAVGCMQTGRIGVSNVVNIYAALQATLASCQNQGGTVTTTPYYGTPPYTYKWSNAATTQNLSNVGTGTYIVTVTDANHCTGYESAFVNIYSPIILAMTTTEASCLYTNDGSISVTPSGGTSPYTYSTTVGTSNVLTNLGTGSYWINVTDAAGCRANGYNFVPYNTNNSSCYCTISGVLYKDINGDCTKDLNEAGIANLGINCSNFGTIYTDATGAYAFKVPTGTYTLSEIAHPYYPFAACQTATTTVTVTAATGCVNTVNSAHTKLPIHDVKIDKWVNGTPPRPGFDVTFRTIISNQGTEDEPNVWAALKSDGQIGVPTIAPNTWLGQFAANNYHATGTPLLIAKNSAETIDFTYTVPTTTPLGTNLVFKDTTTYNNTTTWLDDHTPWNNVCAYTAEVVGAFDPNSKEVNPQGVGESGIITVSDTILNYAVHFENLGNFYAENIVVIDTLDANLDLTTFRPIYNSHICKVSLGDNRILRYEFPHILLSAKPASWSTSTLNQGMFTYSIALKKNLSLGSRIQNKADIYFDFNAPVATNRTLNTIGKIVPPPPPPTPPHIVTQPLKVYPNPATNMLKVEIDKTDTALELKIMNSLGQQVATQTIQPSNLYQIIRIDVTAFAAGVYFVSLPIQSEIFTQKLVKL